MGKISYENFAADRAERVGGRDLQEALMRQINGNDRDVIDIGWVIPVPEGSSSLRANLKADFENKWLSLSVDERSLGAEEDEYETVLQIDVWFHAGVLVEGEASTPLTEENLEAALRKFEVIATKPGSAS